RTGGVRPAAGRDHEPPGLPGRPPRDRLSGSRRRGRRRPGDNAGARPGDRRWHTGVAAGGDPRIRASVHAGAAGRGHEDADRMAVLAGRSLTRSPARLRECFRGLGRRRATMSGAEVVMALNELLTRLWRLGKPFQWRFLWLVNA